MSNHELTHIADDADVFEAFYRKHVDAVQRFVARRVADPYLAADLTADIFLAVIESAHTFRAERGTPTGWLYGVAHKVVSAERRRSAREQRAHRRIAGRQLLTPDDVSRIEEVIDAESRLRDLSVALDRLPDGERAVLELVALDNLTVGDAAVALGIRPVTARVRLHRARNALRAGFGQAPGDSDQGSAINLSFAPEVQS